MSLIFLYNEKNYITCTKNIINFFKLWYNVLTYVWGDKMINVEKDIEYKNIICHILDNEEFNKMKEVAHHDTNRFEQSLEECILSWW